MDVACDFSSFQKNDCFDCNDWLCNIRKALNNCEYIEKIQLLTLLPENFSKREVQDKLPCVRIYMTGKSQKIKKGKGVYSQADPYNGYSLSTEALNVALSYCLEDSKGCSKTSPNKIYVIFIKDDKAKKVKCFMTRSIKET